MDFEGTFLFIGGCLVIIGLVRILNYILTPQRKEPDDIYKRTQVWK